MKNIKIALIGAAGRMGKEILSLIKLSEVFLPYIGVDNGFDKDNNNDDTGFDFCYKKLSDIPRDKINEISVVIDFSLQSFFPNVVNWCVSNNLRLVSGTTGINSDDMLLIEQASLNIPILWSANMSMGIVVLRKALQNLKLIKNFDFQIEEFHHNKKKDKPSGTALMLQKDLESIVEKEVPAPIAIRGGGIFGVHKIFSMSDEEVLCFEHQALNRKIFAKGALHCAGWIINKQNGSYSIFDTLEV